MAKRTIRLQRPKGRRTWGINPVTRVVESNKTYRRSAEREKTREIMADDQAHEGDMTRGRILGIDYGQRRVGLAVSDALGITAQGLETVHHTNEDQLLAQLGKIIDMYGIEKIVVGFPLHMDGTYGEKAKEVDRFMKRLTDHFQLPVIAWDERLTTSAAHRTMHEMGRKAKGAKGKVDRIAAALILQNYLDSVKRDEE